MFVPTISILLEKVRKSSLKGRCLLRLLLWDVSSIGECQGWHCGHTPATPATDPGQSQQICQNKSAQPVSLGPLRCELSLGNAHY